MTDDGSSLVYEAGWEGGRAKLSIALGRPLDDQDIEALSEVAAALGKLLKLLRPEGEDPARYA